MRIRIVTTVSYPDGFAATSRIRCFAKALIAAGDEVEVISPRNIKIFPGSKIYFHGIHDGVNYKILNNFYQGQNRWIKYLLAYLEPLVLFIYVTVSCGCADVYLIYSSNNVLSYFSMIILKLFGKKIIIEVNEYPYETPGSRISRIPIANKILKIFYWRGVFPLANGILVISKALEDVAVKYAPKAKILRIPILTEYKSLLSENNAIKSDQVYLVHAGTLSEQKDGIFVVFQAFVKAHKMLFKEYGIRLKFYLTNRVAQTTILKKIESILHDNNLSEEVIMMGYCEEKKLNDLLCGALVMVINKPDHLQNLYNFPTKLGLYLASHRPVIFAGHGMEVNQYLINEDNAIVVTPNDIDQISAQIVRCYSDPEFSRKIGNNGAETVKQHFYYSNHSVVLSKFMQSLLS